MKLYKREGRRFVEIQDVTGMYLQNNGTYTRNYNEYCVGVCVQQTSEIRKVALFLKMFGNWDECKRFCESALPVWRVVGSCMALDYNKSIQLHMPTRTEMYMAFPYLKDLIKKQHIKEGSYWTIDEYSSYSAWGLDLDLYNYFGYCRNRNKGSYGSVLAFVNLPIE